MVDVEYLDDVLTAAAAVEIMPRYGLLSSSEIRVKTSAFDVVTTVDIAVEAAVSEAIRSRYPEAVIVGEEAADADPSLLTAIDEAPFAVVLDPLDGTKNFTSDLPLFVSMAAVLRRGRIVGAAIHDPVSRTSVVAAEGEGAWVRRAGSLTDRLQVASPAPVHEMEVIAGTRFAPEPMRDRLAVNLARFAGHTWFRCAGHEYRLAASGHVHLLSYHRLMPWDHAPGWLIHREAGGYSAHLDGLPFRPGRMSGGLLSAPDEGSWYAARDALYGDAESPA